MRDVGMSDGGEGSDKEQKRKDDNYSDSTSIQNAPTALTSISLNNSAVPPTLTSPCTAASLCCASASIAAPLIRPFFPYT